MNYSTGPRTSYGPVNVDLCAVVSQPVNNPSSLSGRIQLWGHAIAVDWAEPEVEVDEDTMATVKILYVRNLMLQTTEETIEKEFNSLRPGTVWCCCEQNSVQKDPNLISQRKFLVFQEQWSEWRRSETTPSSISLREKTPSMPWTRWTERSEFRSYVVLTRGYRVRDMWKVNTCDGAEQTQVRVIFKYIIYIFKVSLKVPWQMWEHNIHIEV